MVAGVLPQLSCSGNEGVEMLILSRSWREREQLKSEAEMLAVDRTLVRP